MARMVSLSSGRPTIKCKVMKLKIKIKRFKNENGEPYVSIPKVIKKGDWIDLSTSKEMVIQAPQAGTLKGTEAKKRDVNSEVTYIPLGIAMQLPDGYEAIMASRSSTPKKMGVMMANGIGIVDQTYCGDNDEWHFPAVSLHKTSIAQNSRICQFRIQLSQKATVWQRIKWLFTSGIELVEVDVLDNSDRQGLGSTGV